MIPEVFKSSEAKQCRWSDAETSTVSPDLTGLRRVEQLTVSDDVYMATADKNSIFRRPVGYLHSP